LPGFLLRTLLYLPKIRLCGKLWRKQKSSFYSHKNQHAGGTMDERLKVRSKNRVVVDLRHLSGLREMCNVLDELSPFAGYFCLGSQMLVNHSLTAIMLHFRTRGAKAMMDLNLNLPPEQMSAWAKELKSSGVAMITVQCSAGYQAIKSFMDAIGKNEAKFSDEHETGNDSMFSSPRPLVFGVVVPPHMEQSLSSSVFGDVAQKTVMFNGYIQKLGLDGVICSPTSLKNYHNGYFDRINKLVTGVVPEGMNGDAQRRTIAPAHAISHGADYLLIREPIINPPPGYTAIGEIERMLVEVAHALQSKDRLKRVETPKMEPPIKKSN
jgi:orotidine-5'-phosphate decarboxylase